LGRTVLKVRSLAAEGRATALDGISLPEDAARFRFTIAKGAGMPQYKVVELRGTIGGKISGEKLER